MFIFVRNDHHGRQHRHHSNHLKPLLRDRHIVRLKQGACSVEAGFVWSDLLTDLERTSDHCSNIALSILDACGHNMNAHQSLRILKKNSPGYLDKLDVYSRKYSLPQDENGLS